MRYLITATLLNSWQYNIENGTYEDFLKTLNREKFEPNESILKGFEFEKYMQANYEETKNGAYQVKVSKNVGNYVLYGIIDCLKGGIIYDYKYTKNYETGKFFYNIQTPMYLELVPEAYKMVYLISNKYDEEEAGQIYREEYIREDLQENIMNIIEQFVNWLKLNNLYEIYKENWESKY